MLPSCITSCALQIINLHLPASISKSCSIGRLHPGLRVKRPGKGIGETHAFQNLSILEIFAKDDGDLVEPRRRPNQVWGIDITYIRLRNGWIYLVAVLDWFSRYVLSWELDQTLEIPFVLQAVDGALTQAKPEIWNSDQGSHFTSPKYTERLVDAHVQISMEGKGRALDNIFTERLWRTV